MTGWLIHNEYLQSGKFKEMEERFVQEADKAGVTLICMSNTKVMAVLAGGDSWRSDPFPDFALFLDKDILLALYLEGREIPVFNSAHAIEICDSKAKTHLALWNDRLPMPKTISAPMTYANIGYTNLNFLEKVENEISYPLIIKESYGPFGRQVYFIPDREKMIQKTKELQGKSFVYQEYIESSHGRDIRLQVVGGKVVAAMLRTNDSDFRANITNGGKMISYQPSSKQCELACRACQATGAEFAGVDLLFDKEDRMLVCEVNSNAHFINLEQCTGVNIAAAILYDILDLMG